MNQHEFARKQAVSKEFHDKYDRILTILNKDMRTPTELESNLVDMAFLEAKNYIEYLQVQDKIDTFIVTLKPEGCIFISEGGFAEQDCLAMEKNLEYEQNKQVALHSIKYSKYALWVSIISSLITLLTLLFSVYQQYHQGSNS